MSKAVLIMDMPKNCIKCPFESCSKCKIKPTVGITVIPQKARPELCPLRKLPERKDLSGDVHDSISAGKEIAAASWNACLDAIEGSGEYE